jgi:3,4-dihydroxy 2-butanone 4-phosphate synthase/GTP cyclohydrolase II
MSFLDFRNQFGIRRLGIVIDDSVMEKSRAVMIIPASDATSYLVNEMIMAAKGILFVALPTNRIQLLQLDEMTNKSSGGYFARSYHSVRSFVSVEAREGVSTGISASDRATTLNVLGSRSVDARSIVRPGHIFPVEALEGGVLVRSGIAEAATDCVGFLGCESNVAGFMDCLNERGDLCTSDEIVQISNKWNIPVVSMSEIIAHRLSTESLVTKIAEADLPTVPAGLVRIHSYRTTLYAGDHVALVKGDIISGEPILTRVQVESTLSDIFDKGEKSSRCQVLQSLKLIEERGRGVLVYLCRMRTGHVVREQNGYFEQVGMKNNVVKDKMTTDPVRMRQYGIGAQILRSLGVESLDLISSSNEKKIGLEYYGLSIAKYTNIVS